MEVRGRELGNVVNSEHQSFVLHEIKTVFEGRNLVISTNPKQNFRHLRLFSLNKSKKACRKGAISQAIHDEKYCENAFKFNEVTKLLSTFGNTDKYS